MYLSIQLSIYPSFYLSLGIYCPSILLSNCQSIFSSVYLSIYLSTVLCACRIALVVAGCLFLLILINPTDPSHRSSKHLGKSFHDGPRGVMQKTSMEETPQKAKLPIERDLLWADPPSTFEKGQVAVTFGDIR